MRYLRTARNIILLRVSVGLHFAVSSTNIAGFSNSGSLTNTKGVTKPYLMQLTAPCSLSFTMVVS